MSFNQNMKISDLFVKSARKYGLNLINLDNFQYDSEAEIPFIEFSALKKTNLGKLKQIIEKYQKNIR